MDKTLDRVVHNATRFEWAVEFVYIISFGRVERRSAEHMY
jgi:hypothetical protein